MKKFKLFALALFAMLSTNAFAVEEEFVAYEDANTVFRFQVTAPYVAGTPETLGEATIIGFVADYTAFATTTIPATVNGATKGGKFKVTAINGGAFSGKAITTLDLSAAENLVTIGANAFKGTSITTLDLSATKVEVLNQLFETTNKKVTTVKLPKTLTTIGANAFNGLSALNSVTFKEKTAAEAAANPWALIINGNAFKNTMALTTLTLPGVKYIAANAFAKTYLTTLTISGSMPAYDAEAKKGVAEGAFVRNGDQKLKVNYSPTGANVNPFATAEEGESSCFAEAEAKVWVTLATSTAYGGYIEGQITTFNGVKVSYTPAALAKIKVFNEGSTYSYGTFYDVENDITIAKKQGKANVMVYGAYVDNAKTPAVLMEQMHLIGGLYYIPAGTPIIVKSSATTDVEYTKGAALNGNDSRNYKKVIVEAEEEEEEAEEEAEEAVAFDFANEIKVYLGPDDYAVNVEAENGGYIIFLKPLDETAFGWAEFADDRVIKKGQFYLEATTPGAASRLIWLDGSEEDQVTAIQNVKTAAKNDGAIFNLAGQKVNAAYKGVVIKDGKKYIQK